MPAIARPGFMPGRPRRLSAVLLASVLALPAVLATPPEPASAAVDPFTDPETRFLQRLGTYRSARGLVPLRRDTRLMALARERSTEQAAAGQLSHTTPGGGSVFDRFGTYAIRWYEAAEVIAWNTNAGLNSSADQALRSWLDSPSHRARLMARDLNYIGVGAAIDPSTGRRYWTAVIIRGPDRTGARSSIRSLARLTTTAPAGTSWVRVSWTGWDVRLQVLTAGLRNFDIARRRSGGEWQTIRHGTTATRATWALSRGERWEFRIRARDRRGNVGPWSRAYAITP